MGFPLPCSALPPRTATPRLLARFRDFECPEHAPRSPPGTQTCAVYRRPPCVPPSRERQYSTTVQYSIVQYCTVQYSTVQHSTVQYNTVRYSTVQYRTECSTILLQKLLPAPGLPPLLSLWARRPRYAHVPTQRLAPPKHGLSRTLMYGSHQTVLATPLTCDSVVAPELLVVVLLVHGRHVSILG